MIDILLVARDNNYGLTRDAALLAEALPGLATELVGARQRGLLDWILRRKRGRVAIHLERAHKAWFSAAGENWLMPNQERFPKRQLGRLKRIDRVLAKTRHAETIFAGLGVPTAYVGFTSEDRLDPAVETNWQSFFHLAGGSTLKGTEDVLALWAAHPDWPELVLVQKAENAPKTVPANVRLFSGYLDDAELKRLQNQCGIHLCPSRSEGWGHHIVEGLSVGAVVVTTAAPPMDEHVDAGCGVLVAVGRSEPRHLGTNFHVDLLALEEVVERVIAMTDSEKAALSKAARGRYEQIDKGFHERMAALLEDRHLD